MFTRRLKSGNICLRAISFALFMLLVLQTSCLWAQQLTPAQVQSDLAEFRADLEDRFSYFWYNQDSNGYSAALDSIQAKADANNGMDTNDFRKELHKIIALFIDGHAGVSFNKIPSGELPFRMVDAKGGVVALNGHLGYFDPDFPYITKIDGEDLDVWIDRAKVFVAKSSLQWVRNRTLRSILININFVRHESGLPTSNSISLELKSLSGITKTVTINLGDVAGLSKWPETSSKLLGKENIGYFRFKSFGNWEVVSDEMDELMPKFKNTVGLIIDIRDNTGGYRGVLRTMLPYFMNDRDAPHVANLAKYRLYHNYGEDHLASRLLYRRNTPSIFDASDIKAIDDFNATFVPKWKPPIDKFSEWHYMVVNKRDNPKADFFYDKQVVVLTNGDVFSAADIFSGGLKGWRNITFLGTPTGGGSAASKKESLSSTHIDVTLGSMLSYQNNGLLFDGNGMDVDILVEPIPSDFIVGGTDTRLDSAIAFIHSFSGVIQTIFELKTEIVGNGNINLDSYGGWYDSSDVATATAIPASGWVFEGWSGDVSGSENPLTITMNGDKTITATFSVGPGVIYYTSFENGVLDNAWTTQSSAPEGRIQVTAEYGPHSGNYHLTMDTEVETLTKVTNEAWLHLDLSGKSQVNLNFWWHDYNDGNDEFIDGIFFSDDNGVTFEQVLSLINGTLDYQEINLDVDSLASAKSLNLTNKFIIKFQQSEDNPIPSNDGFGFDDISVADEILANINENKTGEKVRQYVLHQNYPNPFNPTTNIKFDLPENGMVKLNIYNILGQKVLELFNRELNSGQYNYSFDAGNLPSGVYVYKLETKNYNQTRKMILMK